MNVSFHRRLCSCEATSRNSCSISVMAGLVPAIHVTGPPILQLDCRDLVKRPGKNMANLFHFLSWTT
jgi:hypothetical protein